jgi:hypothetical protein
MEQLTASTCTVRVDTLDSVPLFRRGFARSFVNTLVARSKDGGLTFGPPVNVSSATSDWCATRSNIRPNYGDYIGGVSTVGRVLATWADGRSGIAVDTFFAPIFLEEANAQQP